MISELTSNAIWKGFLAAVLSCLTWLIGDLNASIHALAVLYATDFALGISQAWTTKTINRARFNLGLRKSLLYILLLLAANMLDKAWGGQTPPFVYWTVRDFIILSVCIGEFLSIAAHLARMGVRLPKSLLDRLASYHDHPEQAAGMFCGQPYGGIPGTPGQPPQPGQAGGKETLE